LAVANKANLKQRSDDDGPLKTVINPTKMSCRIEIQKRRETTQSTKPFWEKRKCKKTSNRDPTIMYRNRPHQVEKLARWRSRGGMGHRTGGEQKKGKLFDVFGYASVSLSLPPGKIGEKRVGSKINENCRFRIDKKKLFFFGFYRKEKKLGCGVGKADENGETVF